MSYNYLSNITQINTMESISFQELNIFYEINIGKFKKYFSTLPHSFFLQDMKPFACNGLHYFNKIWQTKNDPDFENWSLFRVINEGISSRSILLSDDQVVFLKLDDSLKNQRYTISVDEFIKMKNKSKTCICDIWGCCFLLADL